MGAVVDLNILLMMLVAFAIVIAIAPFTIPFLLKLKVGQTVRDDGPQAHIKKTGTPTMGGIMFIIAASVPCLFLLDDYPAVAPVLALTIGMGLVGFLDDYIKVVLKRSMGLRAWQKLLLQFIITSAFCWYIVVVLHSDLAFKIPFMPERYLDFGIFNIPLLFIVIIGTDNATNLTDGLDGLATTVTIVVAGFFTLAAVALGNSVTPFTAAFVGALLGFLMFNVYPAKVFMGDTGSLALGGFIAATSYVLQMQLFLVIVGIIYVIEALSVMIQVSYFKITHGKRVFKMAPIHHHFELCGWSEAKVVAVFSTITFLAAAVCFYGIW